MKSQPWSISVALLFLAFANFSHAQPSVLQRGYDPGLSGANLAETTLTTSSVSPSTFGLLATLPVDADVYAQPLYVPHVSVAGQGSHNVLYVASMNDTLYAFDADGGSLLWSVNLATSVGATPAPIGSFTFSGNQNIVGNIGILGTPVIDPSTNLMYLVACTLENNTLVWRLHEIDITSGTEPLKNVAISASYGGMTFDGRYQTQRASLTLVGNQVVFAFGPVELEYAGGYSGWVMAYNKQTLAQTGAFATASSGTKGAGVWQSGRPPAVDGAGYVYVFTGNGYTNGYNGTTEFSESALKLDPANLSAPPVDWFTPSNWSSLDGQDLDLGSSGPLIVPNTSPSLLAGGGKAGTMYLLNTSNLQHYTSTNAGALQVLNAAPQFRGGPVYWQRSAANGGPVLYNWGPSDPVKAYAFNGSTFAATPTQQGTNMPVYPGGILSISANGDMPGTGILWATAAASGNLFDDPTDPGILYAMDAGNVATVLWSSNGNPTRDGLGNFAKFVPPTIANGKVYVATFSNKVAVYGLLASATAAQPTFSPLPGTYAGPQHVALSDSTPGAVVHYTTDSTPPTASSATYIAGTPLTIASTETV
ncbi:MAG TPA: chitobiase/beta-hexosaminidase C-terminal domain-containing protein, partial [Steroidobacteraceae bacterium]|nr:chitobiase/beta-hexosaminidase C-terminal domain-containing protein [Steroidobacteraceae bacterium]